MVDFSWKSPGTQLSKYCKFWSCLAKVMLRVSPQVFICPTSALIAHKNSYGSTTGRAKVRAKFFGLYLAQTISIRNHRFQTVMSVKSESGHSFSVCCNPWNFPKKIRFAGQGVLSSKSSFLLWKHFQYPFISYRQPISSLGLECFSTNFPGLRHHIVLLIFTMHRTCGFCVCLIILVTC